jgi:hypothetical protein
MAASQATSSKDGDAIVINDAYRWRGISTKESEGGADGV